MKKNAFMVMPFSDGIVKNAYEYVVKPVFEKLDINIRKADEIWSVNPIYDDIVSEIHKASIIVVDISGKNPNVFYELGIAHTLKRENTIILTHDEIASTPFDVAHFRIIQYSNNIESSKKLELLLENTIKIITSDSLESHMEEFNVVYDILSSEPTQTGAFVEISAIETLGGSVKKNTGFTYQSEGSEHKSFGSSSSLLNRYAKVFRKLEYIEQDKISFYITEKGKLFVRFLNEIKGFQKYEITLHDTEKES